MGTPTRSLAAPLVTVILSLMAPTTFGAELTRISLGEGGAQSNNSSYKPAISADGRFVTFESDASNLVTGDSNFRKDIFVYDRQTGSTTRVSVSTAGDQANASSHNPALSEDGRYVVFTSEATNLVAGDTNGERDVFVHDRQTGSTTRVSVSSGGAEGNDTSGGFSDKPGISGDGRIVMFWSEATNLVAGDTNSRADIFVHDRQTGDTTRVNVASGGQEANHFSSLASLSADGRYVAFSSRATNLVANDTNNEVDIFVHDRQTGDTTRVSVSTGGAQANDGISGHTAISADGRYVAFGSRADNLVVGDTNLRTDVFVHDRQTGTTTRVSVSSSGQQAEDSSTNPTLSADGRYVAFTSSANDLVAGNSNDLDDIYLHDTQTGTTTWISSAVGGVSADGSSFDSAIDGAGESIVFISVATDLVADDTNQRGDVFLYGEDLSGSATSDFDADADSDVLLRQSINGSWRRFLIGNFAVDSSAAMQIFTSNVWTHQTNADFDGDGDADVLIRRNDGVWRVFEVQNGAVVGSSVMSLFLNLTWELQAATDFDGDGDADILARKSDTGAWRIFEVQNRQVVSSAGVGLFPNALWVFQGAADYDGDDDCDVLLRRSDIGRWQIFQMQSGGLVSSAPAGALFLSSSWEYQTSGDMDKDGVADVVLRNTGSGEWRAFKMVNRVVNSVAPLNLFTNLLWEHAQTGDFDGDGDQDLLLRKSDNSFWRFFHIENRQKTGTTAPSIWPNLNFELEDIAP